MRTRRFRFRPQVDVLSLRLALSASVPGMAYNSGANYAETADYDPGCDPMTPQAPDGSVYTVAVPVMPAPPIC